MIDTIVSALTWIVFGVLLFLTFAEIIYFYESKKITVAQKIQITISALQIIAILVIGCAIFDAIKKLQIVNINRINHSIIHMDG